MNDITPESAGELNEPYLTPVQANKIVASLLNPRRRFPIDEETIRFAIKQSKKNAKCGDARVANAAIANLTKMERINQNDDLARLAAALGVLQPKNLEAAQAITQVSVNVGVNVGQEVEKALGSEPEYLDWLRERALAETRDADAMGANGHEPNVSDPAAHTGNGSRGNGHAAGNGRH